MWRQAKIAFWMVVLTVAPIVFFFGLARFLSDKLYAGHWEWFFIVLGLGLGAAAIIDMANGRYGPFRKPHQELLPPERSWGDGLSRSD